MTTNKKIHKIENCCVCNKIIELTYMEYFQKSRTKNGIKCSSCKHPPRLIKANCIVCGKEKIYKPKFFNRIKDKSKIHCKECRIGEIIETNCGTCNKIIKLNIGVFNNKTQNGKHKIYCNKTCRDNKPPTICLTTIKCFICGKEKQIKTSHFMKNLKNNQECFCGRKCAETYRKKDFNIIDWTIYMYNFYLENGRQLSYDENPVIAQSVSRFFGSWINGLKYIGFRVYGGIYNNKKHISADGHSVDSSVELMIDNYLFENNIIHERNKRYPHERMTCDFYLPEYNLWIEYFGLRGHSIKYDLTINKKIETSRINKLNLLKLFPEDDCILKIKELIYS